MTALLGLIAAVVAIIFLSAKPAEGSVPEKSGGLGAALGGSTLPQTPIAPPAAPAAPKPRGVQASNPGAYHPVPRLPEPEPPAIVKAASGFEGKAISSSNFYEVMRPIAEQMLYEFGIRPEAALAQWAHETGKGTGSIFKASNNLGSITAGSWAYWGQDSEWHANEGKEVIVRATIEYTTKALPGDEVLEYDSGYLDPKTGGLLMKVRRKVPFRKYPTLLAAARDWAQLLTQSTRYRAVLQAAKSGDVEGFANALVASGYATDPAYATGIIRAYSELV